MKKLIKLGHKPNLPLMLLGAAVPMVAAYAGRHLIGRGYHAVLNRKPPSNPASPNTEWKDAIMWSIVSGAAGGLIRMASRRLLVPSSIPAEGYDFDRDDGKEPESLHVHLAES